MLATISPGLQGAIYLVAFVLFCIAGIIRVMRGGVDSALVAFGLAAFVFVFMIVNLQAA